MGQQTLIALLLGVPGRGLRTMKQALAALVIGLSLIMGAQTAIADDQYLSLQDFANFVKDSTMINESDNSKVYYFHIKNDSLWLDVYSSSKQKIFIQFKKMIETKNNALCIVSLKQSDGKQKIPEEICHYYRKKGDDEYERISVIGGDWESRKIFDESILHFLGMEGISDDEYKQMVFIVNHIEEKNETKLTEQVDKPAHDKGNYGTAKSQRANKLERESNRMSYNARPKTIIEEVINYSTTGKTEGEEGLFWVQNNDCSVLKNGDINGWVFMASVNAGVALELPGEFNFSTIIQNAFEIKSSLVFGPRASRPIHMYSFSDGKTHLKAGFFLPFTADPPSMSRLEKAWSLAFKECPGKIGRF
jgi:hypothetical protein